MYFLFPSIISMSSSAVASQSKIKSALLILYSWQIDFIKSSSRLVKSTVFVIAIPPLGFYLNVIAGGDLFNLIPKPSSSFSIILLCVNGFRASRTIKIKLQVLPTAITYLPLPLPSLAPSMIPGKSNNYIFAPLYLTTPGIQVKVVNS